MSYPLTLSERETLDLVCSGMSLARYGDGEFNLCRGLSIPTQRHEPELGERLRSILKASGLCLVGIPNLHAPTPKMPFWEKYRGATDLLADRTYGSAFVSRPDSAPWIDTDDYWHALESLWVGQNVTLVRGSGRSLTPDDLTGAANVTDIVTRNQSAWMLYDDLLAEIGTPKRVLLCLGPTATVLAVDLCAMGVHAIDLGHIGMFYRKHLRGEPMIRTNADKVAT